MDQQNRKEISVIIKTDSFVYFSVLKTTNLAFLPGNCLNYTVIYSDSHILLTLTIANFTKYGRTDFTLPKIVTYLRSFTMSYSVDLHYHYEILGMSTVPKNVVMGSFASEEESFLHLLRSDYQDLTTHPCAR